MTETQTQKPWETILSIDEMPWIDPPTLPPDESDLPDSDGEPMESPWHWGSGALLKETLLAARGGSMTDYYIGVNMFVYYSWQQVRNKDFNGPDVYFVEDVDGQKARRYWAIWDESGRYPDLVFEFLSPSTEREDLTSKRKVYEKNFRVKEYFCIAPECTRMLGWRSTEQGYVALSPNEQGWIWSATLNLWIGAWKGMYMAEEKTWPRFFLPDGSIVPTYAEQAKAEAERANAEAERANAEAERAQTAEARIAQLEEELRRLRRT